MRSKLKPSTSRSRALSRKHLKDSIKFNKDHAKEHIKAMKEDHKQLKSMSKQRIKDAKKRGY